MAKLVYGSTQVNITFGHSNWFLSHLQAATQHRFAKGQGYFFTMAGTDDNGEDVSVSYWINPSIPLLFVYDTEDETGERPETVEVKEESVQTLLDAMDRPLGVLWGYYSSTGDGKSLPFTYGVAEDPDGDDATKSSTHP